MSWIHFPWKVLPSDIGYHLLNVFYFSSVSKPDSYLMKNSFLNVFSKDINIFKFQFCKSGKINKAIYFFKLLAAAATAAAAIIMLNRIKPGLKLTHQVISWNSTDRMEDVIKQLMAVSYVRNCKHFQGVVWQSWSKRMKLMDFYIRMNEPINQIEEVNLNRRKNKMKREGVQIGKEKWKWRKNVQEKSRKRDKNE